MTMEDAWVVAARSVDKMRVEIAELCAKLAEHELLLGHAIERDDFLAKLLAGLDDHLPRATPRTVDGIVDAVANMALKLDAHDDASTPAFDEIARLCGCPHWDYPGQVVNDVERVVKARDGLRTEVRDLVTIKEGQKIWLDGARAEISRLREQLHIAESTRDAAQAASNRDLELRREAAAVAATQKAINDAEVSTLRAQVAELEANAVRMREYRFSMENIPTDGKGNPLPGDTRKAGSSAGPSAKDPAVVAYERVYEIMLFWKTLREERERREGRQHLQTCGTAYRGCDPSCPFDRAQKVPPQSAERAWLPSNPPTVESPGQCPWVLADEDPDDGYWHCKLEAGHEEEHVTEFGRGRGERWYRDHLQQADDRTGGPTLGGEDLSPNPECACSPMYRKTLAPGVHAAYCPLRGQPLEPDPPSCKVCKDRGVIETGNNDFPCDCRAGDTAMFNSEGRMQTGAEIKARRR
jgi:hypothetical protein